MEIIAQYSLWFVLLAVLLGVIYSFILYYKNKNIDFEKRPKLIMTIFRGVAVTLIALLVLGIMLKMSVKESEKPILVVAVDNSESLTLTKDSAFYRHEFVKQLTALMQDFGNKYEIRPYLLGSEPIAVMPDSLGDKLRFDQKRTDLSAIFDEINNLYANSNVGAMVLLSDGIYNSGSNPYYKAEKSAYPIYSVGMGNSEALVDLYLADIVHNKQTYKGNFAPIEIKVAATKLSGKSVKLTVTDNANQEVFSKNLTISGAQYFETVRFSIETKEKGIKKYTVTVSNIEGEATHVNNMAAFYLDVIDSRDKIAIIYHSPHPDVSAMKQALELSESFEVTTSSIDEFSGNVTQYALVVLHQLPALSNAAGTLMSEIEKNGVSTLYILGKQSNVQALSRLNCGFNIVQNRNLFNNAMSEFNANFTLFTFSDENRAMLNRMPPLQTLFGEYKVSGGAHVFIYQKINNVTTQYPLFLFADNQGRKIGAIMGEGLWQWRIYNYMYAQNHTFFNDIITKIAHYLSVKGDKSNFRVNSRTLYDEGSAVEFTAELYNDSYELISDPDVSMTLTNSKGKTFEYQFSKQHNAYALNMGILPVDDYQWNAATKVGNNPYRKSGAFTVKEVQLESKNLVADHALLQSMSQMSNGKFFTDKQIGEVSTAIHDNPNITTIATYIKKYSLLLNSWLYLTLILALLAAEWFLRKWNGGY
jgi:hypothetical protein